MRNFPPDAVFDEPIRIERGRAGAMVLCGPDGSRLMLSRRAAGLVHDGLGEALGRAGREKRHGAIGPVTVRVMVAAMLVPMVWIVLAGLGLALAVTAMPVRSARDWLPALALAVLAVAAWLAWILAPKLIASGGQLAGGASQAAPGRGKPHLRLVKS